MYCICIYIYKPKLRFRYTINHMFMTPASTGALRYLAAKFQGCRHKANLRIFLDPLLIFHTSCLVISGLTIAVDWSKGITNNSNGAFICLNAPDFEQVKVAKGVTCCFLFRTFPLLNLTKTYSWPSFCEPIFITPFHLRVNTNITHDNWTTHSGKTKVD